MKKDGTPYPHLSGLTFGTERGLPISCFGSYIEDSVESIIDAMAEVGIMTKHGGGTSGYFGELRSRGSKIKDNGTSFGSVHFMKLYESIITSSAKEALAEDSLQLTFQ